MNEVLPLSTFGSPCVRVEWSSTKYAALKIIIIIKKYAASIFDLFGDSVSCLMMT